MEVMTFRAWFQILAFALVAMGWGIPAFGKQAPFEVGEKLTYHFYWEAFMVARGTFEVTEKKKDGCYVFKVVVQSNKFISSLYPVNDVITSVFDLDKLRSVNFIQDRNEGTDRSWEETFFYYDLKHASTRSYVTGEYWWFEIPGTAVQDKLSTIYCMRCLDWKDRKEATATLGNDKGNYDIVMKRVGEEKLEMDDFKTIPTFKVEPSTEYLKGFVKSGQMWAWVSDDKFKIPVRVVAKLSFGTVSASLVKVEGVTGWPYKQE